MKGWAGCAGNFVMKTESKLFGRLQRGRDGVAMGWLGWQLRNEKEVYIAWILIRGGGGYGLAGLAIVMKRKAILLEGSEVGRFGLAGLGPPVAYS